jgi:hypothetical protein
MKKKPIDIGKPLHPRHGKNPFPGSLLKLAVAALALAALGMSVWMFSFPKTPTAYSDTQKTGAPLSSPGPLPVAVKECSGNESRPCIIGQCQGVQKCSGGAYSDCLLPRKICIPGEKSGCTLDSCQFGYMACNSCGTGFLPCAPEVPLTANSIACQPSEN